MIYPQKLTSKKSNELVNVLIISSIMIGIVMFIINKITSPKIPWSAIANAGLIYVWITVLYSIRRNTNLAGHILLQVITMSLVIFYIDKRLNFYGWSIYIGIPIILMVANVTMLVLAIVGHKNYFRYAIYQLIIVFLSIIQLVPVLTATTEFGILNIISAGVSLLNFVISLILSYKDFYKIIVCKFHM